MHNLHLAKRSDILILSIKPQILESVVREVAPFIAPSTLVISVAAGVDSGTIEGHLRGVVSVRPT